MTTWGDVQKVAIPTPFPNAPEVPHVIGLVQERDCGCEAAVGMRLDRMEPTFGANPCADHGAECQRALLMLGAMPPSDEPVLALFRDILDAAIGSDE